MKPVLAMIKLLNILYDAFLAYAL